MHHPTRFRVEKVTMLVNRLMHNTVLWFDSSCRRILYYSFWDMCVNVRDSSLRFATLKTVSFVYALTVSIENIVLIVSWCQQQVTKCLTILNVIFFMVLLENRFFGHNEKDWEYPPQQRESSPFAEATPEYSQSDVMKLKKGDKGTFWVVTEEKV